jgi:hypothetical protein
VLSVTFSCANAAFFLESCDFGSAFAFASGTAFKLCGAIPSISSISVNGGVGAIDDLTCDTDADTDTALLLALLLNFTTASATLAFAFASRPPFRKDGGTLDSRVCEREREWDRDRGKVVAVDFV